LKKPKKINKDQAWFWTKEWQKGEREVDEEIRKGHILKAKNVEELKKLLRRPSPKV